MPFAKENFENALFETFPECVIFADDKGMILSLNAAGKAIFGYKDEELVGRYVAMLHADEGEFNIAKDQGFLSQSPKTFDQLVFRYRRKDASEFLGQLTGSRVLDAEGALQGYIGVVRDVTEQVARDEYRRALKQATDAALDAVPVGFAIFDENLKVLLFNQAYRNMCGKAAYSVAVGATLDDILQANMAVGNYLDVPPGSPGAQEWLKQRRADNSGPSSPVIFRHGDDRWIRSESLSTPHGHIVSLRIDVTDIKQAELALEAKRREYFSLLQVLPEMVLRVDDKLNILFANNHYAARYNMTGEEIAGKNGRDLWPAEQLNMVTEAFDRFTPDQPVRSKEYRYTGADGRDSWVLWTGVATFVSGKPVELVTVGRDVTELKDQQDRLSEQAAELQRKNDALNQFTATVSHDLKAPLRHLSMFSDMISEDVASGHLDELPVYTQHLRQSARRMDQLIDSLLEYAQIVDQIDNWQHVSLSDVIADTVSNLDSFIHEAGAIMELGPLPRVRGDGELLKRLLQNLIGNAVKYRRDDVVPVIKVYGDAENGVARLYVEDNGIGVDPRYAKKIFDVFQRLHRDESRYPGTGIGLSLAKRIAESHNGSIELDTTFQGGARFIVTLPEAPKAED
ncbi:PAS domain-containing sensor histidine kinase [Pararhizobium arenae]|uniref:PAS domain-containing sensor histidine kinase n=1 Tax=Pararhizobium arenae TaxID=1856850 RepID=UPI00094B75D2|nr:PAS domain S-box protein [Pararhizobium arenae]